jgi:hypothetical protein
MQTWKQLVWERPPETDAHCDSPRDPYQRRNRQATSLLRPSPRLTDFVSQYAIGDHLAVSAELLLHSRQLIADSKAQVIRVRMHLLLSHTGKSVQ